MSSNKFVSMDRLTYREQLREQRKLRRFLMSYTKAVLRNPHSDSAAFNLYYMWSPRIQRALAKRFSIPVDPAIKRVEEILRKENLQRQLRSRHGQGWHQREPWSNGPLQQTAPHYENQALGRVDEMEGFV